MGWKSITLVYVNLIYFIHVRLEEEEQSTRRVQEARKGLDVTLVLGKELSVERKFGFFLVFHLPFENV